MSQTGKCSHCGSPLQEGMRFCWNCGTEIKKIAENTEPPVSNRVTVNQNTEQQQRRPYAGADQQTMNRTSVNQNAEQQQRRPYAGVDQQAINRAYTSRNSERQRRPYESEGQPASNRPYANQAAGQLAANRTYMNQDMVQPSAPHISANRSTAQAMNAQRYKQEEMERDWEQSWDREEEDDGSFTPIQYVLIGIAVVLLMALVGFGVYWILGKSTGNTGRRPDADQERIEQLQTGQEETGHKDEITILDDTRDDQSEQQTEKQSEKQTGKVTEKQTEKPTERQTEKQTEKPTERQTEKQTEKPIEKQTEKQTEKPTEAEIPEIEIISEDYYVIEAPTESTAEVDYSGGYIPESSQRTLTDADVEGMTYDDLQMAINEIYARHGRIFRSEAISSYFNSQPWYQGTVTAENFNEGVFNSVESQNIQFLLDKMGN